MYQVPKQAPSWIVTLDIAQRWFLPPYKIAGGTKTLWYAREEVKRDMYIRKQRKDSKK